MPLYAFPLQEKFARKFDYFTAQYVEVSNQEIFTMNNEDFTKLVTSIEPILKIFQISLLFTHSFQFRTDNISIDCYGIIQ